MGVRTSAGCWPWPLMRFSVRHLSRLLVLLVAAAVVLLLVGCWSFRTSPAEEAQLHAEAFERTFGWLKSRSLRAYVYPERNSSLLVPRCATSAAVAPLLVAVVISAPSHVAARRTIRATWGRQRQELKVVFLVGQSGDATAQVALAAEAAEHGDVIQEPFVEHYQNLTVKSVMMLKWLSTTACGRSAPFALKVDDDMWVDMPALITFLRTCARIGACANDAPVIAGRVYSGITAYRGTGSRYYLPPRLFSNDLLPDLVSGTAYVISRSATKPLYAHALKTPFVNLEDLFVTGLVARRAGVRLVHVEGFQKAHPVWVHTCTCRDYVTVHALTPEQVASLDETSGDWCGPWWAVINLFMPWVI